MKKTRLSIIILLALILTCNVFIFVSCSSNNNHTHNFSTEWVKDGTYHWQACSGCDEIRNKAKHDWDSGTTTIYPTETSNGSITYTCDTCGKTKVESIPALNSHEHTFSSAWAYDDTNHWHSATCEHTSEKKDFAEHDWDDGVITKQPTETTDGKKTYTCTVCQKTKVVSVGDLNHVHTYDSEYSFNDDYHWYAATCEHTSEVKGKEPHNWDEGEVIKATVYEDGAIVYTCQDCGHVKEEPIAKIPSFTVNFYNFENKAISSRNYELNTSSSDIFVPTIQVEDGYRFEAWVSINDSKNISAIDFSKAQENAIYQFKPTSYKIHEVIFTDYTGNQLGETLIIKDGETIKASDLPTIPTRTAYTSKWAEEILTTKITENKVFSPVYEVITFTVTFLDSKNGNKIGTKTVEYGSFAIIPEYDLYSFNDTRLCEFTGWKSSATDTFIDNVNGNKITDVISDLTVYAVYEERLKQPVLAMHIVDKKTVTISLCLPDECSLYSINASMSWTTEKGISAINSVNIATLSYLDEKGCNSQESFIHIDKDEWITYNNKTQTFDFVWSCGNGHSFSVDRNILTINFDINEAEINEDSFSVLEGSAIVYGENGADIKNLKKSNITIWFY